MKICKAAYAITTLMIVCATTGVAQSFTDGTNEFRITLTEDWRGVTYTDAFRRHRTEFVRGQRNDGLLRISKDTLSTGSLDQVVDRELADLRSHKGKYLLSGRDAFEAEALSGIRIAFYYTERGRRASGTYYFLEDTNAVWILRFTGPVGSLDAHRDVIDQIARSFRPN
jgi:hypothetical protein